MVFGLNEKQRLILGYLYDLRNTPETPSDPRLEINSIAKYLGMTQREVRQALKKLVKWGYVKFFTFEGHSYYKILPRGIRGNRKV